MKKYYCKEKGCNNEISDWNHNYGLGFCRSCAHIGKRNHFYGTNQSGDKNGKWTGGWKHFCEDCGVKIDFDAIRCRHHARIEQYKNHPELHPFLGKHHTDDDKIKIGKSIKKLWKIEKNRDRFIKAQRAGMKIYPNKPEKVLGKIISSLSKDYKYTGDGSFIIDGFNPDFINTNGQKKVIELFGTYWHKRPEVIKRDKRRIKSYKKYGYKTLIVWEYELKNIDNVIKKVSNFI